MKKYFCTYFDRNYFVKGLALIESLNKHERSDFKLFVVCLDEITRVLLEKLGLKNVTAVPFHEIEHGDQQLLETGKSRSLVEYYWTSTPTVILRVLERNPEIDVLTYLDADLFFYGPSDPIYDELGGNSVLIHEHRFPPQLKALDVHGKYNVGLLCFRNNDTGIDVLKWWRRKCIEWCYGHVEDGKFADQAYLNDWPARFKQVTVLQHAGAGVGPWNHEQYVFDSDASGRAFVDGEPLVFYHFHALSFVSPDIIVPAKHLNYPLTAEILRLCFLPYIHALSRAVAAANSVFTGFMFGLSGENIISSKHTFLARKDIASAFNNPDILQFRLALDDIWFCYCSGQMKEISSVISRAEKMFNAGRTDEASLTLAESIKQYPASPDLYNLQAELKFRSGDTQGAVELFMHIIDRWPACYAAYNNLGVIFWEAGDVEKAVSCFDKAVAINDPTDTATVNNYGNVLISLKRYEHARKLFESSMHKTQNSDKIREITEKLTGFLEESQSLNSLGESLFGQGDIQGAEKVFLQVIENCSDFVTAYNNLGVLYWQRGNPAEASKYFSGALETDPDCRDAVINHADMLRALDKTEEAQRLYLAYIKNHPDDKEILSLAQIHSGAGKKL